MDPVVKSMLVSASTSFATGLATKGIKGPAQTLDDLWEFFFGDFHLYIEKKRAREVKNLDDYKNKIANNICKIPQENIQDPPLNIAGPVLDASKYYIEKENIRDMFAKLLAASMDSRISNKVHNSYVEIIKQLSSLDAQNLIIISKHACPIVEYQMTNPTNHNYTVAQTNVFIENSKASIDDNAISISNLSRLELININYESTIVSPNIYDKFKQTDYFKILDQESQNRKIEFNRLSKLSDSEKAKIIAYDQKLSDASTNEVNCGSGLVYITPYGAAFVEICC